MEKTTEADFEINDLLAIALVFVVLGLLLTYSADIQQDVRDDQVVSSFHCGLNSTNGTGGTLLYDGCGYAYNISGESLETTSTFSEKSGTIAKVVIAAVIIVILMTYFYMRMR